MEVPQSEKILEQPEQSSDHIMKIHNEENNLSDLMANIDQHRSGGLAPTTTSEQQSTVSADSGNSTAGNSESMLPEIGAFHVL